MIQAWVDAETSGLNPVDSGAFEIAFKIYRGAYLAEERVFYLNPLSSTVLWHESAFRVNGVSEEKIQSYPAVEYVIPKIAAFLHNYSAIEKMVFAGYCCDFDYRHVDTLFSRCGYSMSDYFNGRLIDVFELVKKASGMGLLPAVPDKKLSTMAKALGIELAHAHTALADITATRLLYEKLYKIWREQR